MMDEERYNRWKKASLALFQVEPHLAETIQALGRIDADLYLKDIRYREIREKHDGTSEEWEEMSVHSFTMSYLWTLGAYEVIRTLDQLFRLSGKHKAGLFCGSTELKYAFERVRMPLAKLEAANRFKDTDRRFAHPALISGKGIGWTVADDTHISRGGLSTLFLDFLESMHIARPE